jgi:hypothetical protein
MHTGFVRRLAHRYDERTSAWHPRVVAPPWKGVDDVIHSAKDTRAVRNPAAGLLQALEREGAGAFVKENPINGEQRGAVRSLLYDMLRP